jgi:hypothetical protein
MERGAGIRFCHADSHRFALVARLGCGSYAGSFVAQGFRLRSIARKRGEAVGPTDSAIPCTRTVRTRRFGIQACAREAIAK